MEPKNLEAAFSLDEEWKTLIREAKIKDFQLQEVKQDFSKVTINDVIAFKEKVEELYEEFKEKGPGANDTNLDDGLVLMTTFKAKIGEFNKHKEELINAERLFNLPLSSFDKMVLIE